MASPWEEQVDTHQGEQRPGWSWPARLWLGWWLLVAAGVLTGIIALVQQQRWGGGLFALGLLAGVVTLVPWLTWLAEQRVRHALELVTLSPQAPPPRRGWSRGGILWIVTAAVVPGVGILLGILAQNPQWRDTAGGLLALWLMAVITLFLFFVAWLRRRVRMARAMEAGYLMNFTYTELLHFSRKPTWRVLPLFERSKVQIARHVLDGQVGPMDVTVLEWADPEMAIRFGRTGLPVVVVRDGVHLPVFELQPRRSALFGGQGGWAWLHLLHGPVGILILILHWAAHRYSNAHGKDAREVALEEPFFQRRYQLLSHDEDLVALLFTPAVCLNFQGDKADWLLQSNGEQLLLCNLRGNDDPNKYPQFVARGLQLAQLLHDTYSESLERADLQAQMQEEPQS